MQELLRWYIQSQHRDEQPVTYSRMRSSTPSAHSLASERARIPDLSTSGNPKYYYIKNAATGEYLSYGQDADVRMTKTPNDSAKFFYGEVEWNSRGDGGHICNYYNKSPYWGLGTKKWGTYLTQTPIWYFQSTEDKSGCYISSGNGVNVWRYDPGQKKLVYGERDEYAVWVVEAVPSLPSTYSWYVVKNVTTGKYLHYEGASSAMSLVKSPDPCSLFSASYQGDGVVVRNHASGNLVYASEKAWSTSGTSLKFINSGENDYHFYISASGNKDGGDVWYHDETTNTLKVGSYGDNSLWEFERITNFKEIFGYCSNGEDWNELNLEYEKLVESKEKWGFFEIYAYTLAFAAASWNMGDSDLTYDEARNVVTELKTLLYTIDVQYGSGEDVMIRNIGHDNVKRNLATNSSSLIFNDAEYSHTNVWQMIVVGDLLNANGSIKLMLYNTVAKMYVAAPKVDANGVVTVGMTANEEEAGSWLLIDASLSDNGTFRVESKLESESLSGCFLQLANPEDVEVSCVMVDREGSHPKGLKWEFLMGNAAIDKNVYDYTVELATRYLLQFQETIGCAGYYTCNYSSSVSTNNLLDYDVTTTFLTNGNGGKVDKPYLQADLGVGKSLKDFYFYMRSNLQSWQGVPVSITVSGSNSENDGFVKLAKVETSTLLYDMNYFSELIKSNDGASYRYLRFTIDEVTGGGGEFALSEFYILPNTSEVTEIGGLIRDFYASSYMGTEILVPAVELIKLEAEYYLNEYKDNHAISPVVDQCSTFKYNALLDAYNAVNVNNKESITNLVNAIKDLFSTELEFICILKSAWEDGFSKNSAVGINLNNGYLEASDYNEWDLRQWCVISSSESASFAIEFFPVEDATIPVALDDIDGWEQLYASQRIAYNIHGAYGDENGYLSVIESSGAKRIKASASPATSKANKNSAWYLSIISSRVDVPRVSDKMFIEALAKFGKTFAEAKYYNDGAKIGKFIYVPSNDLDKEDFDEIYNELEYYYNLGVVELVDLFVNGVLTHEMLEGLDYILGELRAHFPNFKRSRDVIAGYYFRLRGKDTKAYLTSNANGAFGIFDAGNESNLADEKILAEAEEQTIFYTVPNGDEVSMMSFSSGRYVHGANGSVGYAAIPVDGYGYTMQTAGLGYSLSENAYSNTIILGGKHYLSWKGLKSASVSTKPVNDNTYDWEVEEVEELPIKISSALFATLYVPVELIIPEGITAYVLYDEKTTMVGSDIDLLTNTNFNSGQRVLRLKEIEGGILPAGLPVILQAETAGTYYFEINYEPTLITEEDRRATYSSDDEYIVNLLDGRHAATYIPSRDGYIHYILANKSKGVGMYKVVMKDESGVSCFQNNAHRAWLPNPIGKTIGASGYRFSVANRTDATVIEDIFNESIDGEIYDLQGRRVPYMTKGVYIVNGKKVIK